MEKPFALIVEDDRDISTLLHHVLEIAGYQTKNVYDGKEAIQYLHSTRPDIILLDLSLPSVSGSKILRYMRASDHLQGVPVIVITGYSDVANHLPVKPELVLLKPVNLDQLSSLVQRLQMVPMISTETPWDETTHLYNRAFFSARVSYSLERAKQIGKNRFGVMFVDLEPFTSPGQELKEKEFNDFLRMMTPHLKASLRPTDTIARAEAGFFLILIEDVPDDGVPEDIASRIRFELGNYLQQMFGSIRARAYIGVLLCDAGYESAQEILRDVDIARKLVRTGNEYERYDREMLVDARHSLRDVS